MNIHEIWLSGTGWPVAVWWLVLLAIAWFVRRTYYKAYPNQTGRHLWWIRFAAIALTLVALADLTRKQFQVQLPELIVAIDTSQSSGIAPNETDRSESRLNRVKQILSPDRIEKLAKRYRLSFWAIGSGARKIGGAIESTDTHLSSLVADQAESRLGAAILEIAEHQIGRQTAGILMFSDGAVTSGISLEDAGLISVRQAIPVFAVGLGSLNSPPNLKLTNLQVNRRVRVNEPLSLTIDLAADSMKGESCTISVNDLESGQQLVESTIDISTDRLSQIVPLTVVNATEGNRTLVVSVSSDADEINPDDNHVSIRIQVVPGKTRVLIVQDLPSPWYRYLKRTLQRAVDPETGLNAFQVDTLLQQSAVDYNKIDASALDSFPNRDALQNYDLIVIGDVLLDPLGRDRGLTPRDCDSLESYARNLAGNLVFVPGPSHFDSTLNQPALARLLPLDGQGVGVDPLDTNPQGNSPGRSISEQSMRLEFTPISERLSATRGIRTALGPNPTSRFYVFPVVLKKKNVSVVAEFWSANNDTQSNPLPAITHQRIGNGTVVTHFSDELYKLGYRSDNDLFETYWLRLVTELSSDRLQRRDRLALISTDASEYSPDDNIDITAEIFDPSFDLQTTNVLDAELIDDEGTSIVVTLSQTHSDSPRFETTLNQQTVGTYRLALAIDGMDSAIVETGFSVTDGSTEMSVLNQQKEQLSRLAENSGGYYVGFNQVDQVWNKLPMGGWNQAGPATTHAIWSTWFVPFMFAALVIGLLVIEWIIRSQLRLE